MTLQFHVGQTVYLRPLRGPDAAVGAYEIRAVMPEEESQARYRIKSLIEPHERVDPDYLEDVDEWRRDEPGNLSRSQAMRELVLKGLRAAYKERKQAARLAMTEQRSLSFRLYT